MLMKPFCKKRMERCMLLHYEAQDKKWKRVLNESDVGNESNKMRRKDCIKTDRQ